MICNQLVKWFDPSLWRQNRPSFYRLWPVAGSTAGQRRRRWAVSLPLFHVSCERLWDLSPYLTDRSYFESFLSVQETSFHASMVSVKLHQITTYGNFATHRRIATKMLYVPLRWAPNTALVAIGREINFVPLSTKLTTQLGLNVINRNQNRITDSESF